MVSQIALIEAIRRREALEKYAAARGSEKCRP
jgi:hypothetical protein